MNALYAALSGAFLLGSAALASAQNMTTTTTDKATSPQSGAVHTTRDKVDKVTTAATPGASAGQGISRDEYKREKDRVEAEAKAAKEKCKSMKDNARDICQAEAKANEKVAKAELDAKRKGNDASSDYKVAETKAKANYDVAKEKCDDMKGKEKSACKKQAKADEDKALAEAKSLRKNVASANGHSRSKAGDMGSSTTGTSGTAK
jgi:hypothetical protein